MNIIYRLSLSTIVLIHITEALILTADYHLDSILGAGPNVILEKTWEHLQQLSLEPQ